MDKRPFCLEGRFEGFTAGGKSPFKYLSLQSTDGNQLIKLPKSVRMMLFRYLQPGDWIRVVGRESIDKETGEPNFKAQEVVRVKPLQVVTTPAAPPQKMPKTKPGKSKILICQKSKCRKRGAEKICAKVEDALASQGLTDTVQVKLTSCMDRCKAGPNLVVMPHKKRYTKVTPAQIPDLIAQHFQPKSDVG
ncbi:MAG: (2Fe-2S) ferredoxin domain-containing protein [Cyanobacteria bacterium P01_D01_bin.156]